MSPNPAIPKFGTAYNAILDMRYESYVQKGGSSFQVVGSSRTTHAELFTTRFLAFLRAPNKFGARNHLSQKDVDTAGSAGRVKYAEVRRTDVFMNGTAER